ncbi:beta-ketoacyl synthase chain length factor [Comamonas thiooxydans]|uniref:beta-ketoacyl synthase chain length factor n=1 Tax=Comamonas thiooxydans TaxID=363952 RepID=UPI00351A4F23
MRRALTLRAWSALAPGLQTNEHWWQWSKRPVWPSGEVMLDLSHIPAMARRRLGPQAKWVVSVADAVLAHAAQPDLPMVWVSRYGDAEKSLALLQDQAAGAPLSPTAFGLSVHNGIGAQHSILHGMRANSVCVASAHAAPEAGVVEALGLLHEGAPEVMLVCYDAPLPEPYDRFHDEPVLPCAWAVLLALAAPGEPGFRLQAQAGAVPSNQSENMPKRLPYMLEVLQFLLQADQSTLGCPKSHADRNGHWHWEHCHG